MSHPALARSRARAARPGPALVALALVAAFGCAEPASAAPRLVLLGGPLTAREAEGAMAPALRAPGDTAALARGLTTLVARLQELGWLDAHASAAWDSSAGPSLEVRVSEGPRRRFAPIAIDAPPEDSARFAPALATLASSWAETPRLAAALERAVSEAEAAGHPYAQIAITGWRPTEDAVHVRLTGTLGPRVVVDSVRVVGLVATRPELARRALGRLEGVPYNPAAARAAVARLEQLRLFRRVTYEGLEGGSDWGHGRLVYRVEEPRYNRFEGAIGAQGEAGVVGLARLDLGNLIGTGRSVGLSWQSRGRGLSDFAARYAEPLVLGWPVRFEVAVAQQLQDTLYTRSTAGARARFVLSTDQTMEVGFEGERVVQTRGEVATANLQNTVFALERDHRDDAFAPRRGTRLRLSAMQVFKGERLRAVGASGAPSRRSARASAAEAHLEWHRPVGRATGVAIEGVGAGRFSSQRVLPEFERLPLGGTATLRGFDEESFRVDQYALARSEWRWFLGANGERIALFWDHAWMQTREPDGLGGDRAVVAQRDGVGFGLRLPAAGSLVDVDYAIQPGRGALDGKIHLRLVTTF